jgi:hypothetical protein
MAWVWADRTGVRNLFIVSRAEPQLFERLVREFDGDHAVRVILDRRSGELRRRHQARATLTERRRRDRRVRTSTADELQTRGCAIVSVL